MEIDNSYDTPEVIQARKNQEDPWILYVVVRESLPMGRGKIAAQVGHAVGMVYEKRESLKKVNEEHHQRGVLLRKDIAQLREIQQRDYYTVNPVLGASEQELAEITQTYLSNEDYLFKMDQWRNNSFRKVVLRASDTEFEKLKEELECFVVRDAGLTEVAPGSETVLAFWPMQKSEAPRLIVKLQVLK